MISTVIVEESASKLKRGHRHICQIDEAMDCNREFIDNMCLEYICRNPLSICPKEALDWREERSDDPLSSSHYPLQGFFVWHVAVRVPYWYTLCQNTLNHTSVKGPAGGEKGLFNFLRKCSVSWACFVITEVFLFQLRSWEICTPRNLMFSTLSTKQWLMLMGMCSVLVLWKSTIISFVLSMLSSSLFSLHQPLRFSTSSLYID